MISGQMVSSDSYDLSLENRKESDIISVWLRKDSEMANNTYDDIMNGNRDNNIRFADLQKVLKNKGFEYRVKVDHFIYYRNDIPEIINIQPKGNKAKGYEVKQIRLLFNKYGM